MNLLTEDRDGVRILTLNRPEKRNALDTALSKALLEALRAADEDEEVRCVVLTGAGQSFCAGADLSEFKGLADPQAAEARAELTMHLHLAFSKMAKPVVTAINGAAMGGGCEFTLACDFRIMASGYQIGLPEVRVGILPGAGGTQRMARLLGTAKAMELMLLGNTVDADTAASIGLVHRAVEKDRVLPEAMALANELASRPRLSVALIKKLVLEGVQMPLEEALQLEQRSFNETMRSDDASRLMRAYLKSERPLNEQ